MTDVILETAVEGVAEVATTEATTVAENTTVQADFLSTLSEDLRGVKSLEKFKGKDANEVIKSYLNLEKLASGKNPTAPEKYILANGADEIFKEGILNIAKKGNITQEQLKLLSDGLIEDRQMQIRLAEQEATRIMEERKTEIQKKLGLGYEGKMASVKKVLTQYGDAGLEEALNKTGLMHDVKFVSFLDTIVQEALQVKLHGTEYQAQRSLSPEEALREIELHKADKNFMAKYSNNRDLGHEEAVKEWTKLFNSAYGTVQR